MKIAQSRPASPPRAPRSMRMTTCLGLAALMSFFFLFWNLHVGPLSNWDEAWYAKVALDMARSGEWLRYDVDGEIGGVALKPPLCYWVMALLFRGLGPGTLAARLFSAVCYLCLVLVVAAFCHRHLNWRIALGAAFLLLTDRNLVFTHCARSGDMDAPLMLFLTLTVLSAWALRVGKSALWGCPAWACALLVKGHAAVQILPAMFLWFCVNGSWRPFRRFVLLVVLGMIPLVTFLAMRESRQPGVAYRVLTEDVWLRLRTEFDTSPGPSFVYARKAARASWPVAVGIALTVLLLRGRLRLRRQLADRADMRVLLSLLLFWWIVPVAMFSVAQTKHIWYLYPSFVPAYILAAWLMDSGMHRLVRGGRRFAAGTIAVVIVAGMGLPAAWKVVHRSRHAQQRSAELCALIAALEDLGGDAKLITIWPDPRTRFVLTRAGIDYTSVHYAREIRGLPGDGRSRLVLLYAPARQPEVEGALRRGPPETMLELPTIGLRLSTLEPG